MEGRSYDLESFACHAGCGGEESALVPSRWSRSLSKTSRKSRYEYGRHSWESGLNEYVSNANGLGVMHFIEDGASFWARQARAPKISKRPWEASCDAHSAWPDHMLPCFG